MPRPHYTAPDEWFFRASSWTLAPCEGTCLVHIRAYDGDSRVGADIPLTREGAKLMIQELTAFVKTETTQ